MALFHVIDDEKFMCDLISKMLAMKGHEALSFQDPQHYLQFLNQEQYVAPAAVITDILMPTMDGYELIDAVLRHNSEQKFIVISGTPHISHRIQHKACHYLAKPFRIPELTNIIQSIVRCNSEGPSPAIGCQEMGNREMFLAEWYCPLPQIKSSS